MRTLVTLLAFLALAAPASAGTATATFSSSDYKTIGDRTLVGFTAAPGDSDRVAVTATLDDVRFTGEAPVQAGEGCEQINANEALCRRIRSAEIVTTVGLGDGDDRVQIAGTGVSVGGGDGDDELLGGDGDDVLHGGPGADVVRGGGGIDAFDGDTTPAEAPDLVDGGPGRDHASFAGAEEPVLADLRAGTVRVGTKTTTVQDVEAIIGSEHDDQLRGGPGADGLYGLLGDDLVEGRGGKDRLNGGYGRDTVKGGSGDDVLEADEYEELEWVTDADIDLVSGDGDEDTAGGNRLVCGPGTDFLADVNRDDIVAASCEDVIALQMRADPRRRASLRVEVPRCRRCRAFFVTLSTARSGPRARPRTQLVRRRVGPGKGVVSLRLGRRARATIRRERASRIVFRFSAGDIGPYFIALGR